MGGTVCTEPQCLYKGALYLFSFLGIRRAGFKLTTHLCVVTMLKWLEALPARPHLHGFVFN